MGQIDTEPAAATATWMSSCRSAWRCSPRAGRDQGHFPLDDLWISGTAEKADRPGRGASLIFVRHGGARSRWMVVGPPLMVSQITIFVVIVRPGQAEGAPNGLGEDCRWSETRSCGRWMSASVGAVRHLDRSKTRDTLASWRTRNLPPGS